MFSRARSPSLPPFLSLSLSALPLVLLVATLLPGVAARAQEKPSSTPSVKLLRSLEGHGADVYCVRFSPDGKLLASSSFDKSAKLWQVGPGKPIATLEGHQGKVLSVAFSPSGRLLATASEDKTAKLWDVPAEGAVSLAGHTAEVTAIAASPDGAWLASGSKDGTVRLFRTTGGIEVLKLEAGGGGTLAVAFAEDGKHLVSGGADGSVSYWDISSATAAAQAQAVAGGGVELLKQGSPWRYRKGKDGIPAEWRSLEFDDSSWAEGGAGFGYSEDASELTTIQTKLEDMVNGYVSCFIRTKFRIEDPALVQSLKLTVLIDDGMIAYLNGVEVGRDNMNGDSPPPDAVTPDKHEALAVEIDLGPHLKRLVAGDNVLSIQGHNQKLDSSDFVLTPTLTGVFKKKGDEKPAEPKLELARLDAGGPATSVAVSADLSLVAAASAQGTARVWRLAEAKPQDIAVGAGLSDLAFLGSEGLACACEDGKVRTFRISDGASEKTLEGHEGRVNALVASPDGKRLLSAGSDGSLRLWDTAGGTALKTIRPDGTTATGGGGGQHGLNDAVLSRDGKVAVVGGQDGTLRVIDLESEKEIKRFEPMSPVTAVALGSDDRYYSAGGSAEVAQWRTSSVGAIRTFSGHGEAIHWVEFSPDGAQIATASRDKTVRLWNIADGAQLRSINAHDSTVYTLAFSPNGALLATAGLEPVVKIWNVADGALQKKLEGHLEGIFCVRFSPAGDILYSASSDRTIRLWSVADGTEVGRLEGHPSWVVGLSVLPGGERLRSADYAGSILTWELKERKLIGSMKAPGGTTFDFATSPDGKIGATASRQGAAFLFDLE